MVRVGFLRETLGVTPNINTRRDRRSMPLKDSRLIQRARGTGKRSQGWSGTEQLG